MGSLAALAATGTTLAIYMGMNRIDSLATALLQHLPAHTPVAIVQSASQASETRLVTTLQHLLEDARAARVGSPGVILVGMALAEAVASVVPACEPLSMPLRAQAR